MLKDQWSGLVWPASSERDASPVTGVEVSRLQEVGRASVAVPDGFVRLEAYIGPHCADRLGLAVDDPLPPPTSRQAPAASYRL